MAASSARSGASVPPGACPTRVDLCDVGPRDGLQFEATPVPTDAKVAWITALADAGVPRIQVTSFVHPKWVPQMADAEEVVAQLPAREDVVYTGLVLNRRGLDRARATALRAVDLSIATNEQHSRDNANRSVDEGWRAAIDTVEAAVGSGLETQIGLQTVFGYGAPGDTPLDRVLRLLEPFVDLGVESISLADSTGMANPVLMREVVRAVQAAIGAVPLVLHLHDTRGLGLANVVAALGEGVDRFDTSFGGLGGCPFIPGATGNIATEDTVYLLEAMGIGTGIDRAAVAAMSRQAEALLGHALSGKLYRLTT